MIRNLVKRGLDLGLITCNTVAIFLFLARGYLESSEEEPELQILRGGLEESEDV